MSAHYHWRGRTLATLGALAGLGLTLTLGLASTGCEEAASGVPGAPCSSKAECASGYCLLEERYSATTGWTDGYCTQDCAEAECEGGATCLQMGLEWLCLAGCSAHSDCRAGYLCQPVAGACLPDCRRGWSCGEEFVCGSEGFCTLPGTDPQVEGEPDGGVPDAGGGEELDAGVPDDGGSSADAGSPDPDVGPPPVRPVGAPCAESRQCSSDFCQVQRAEPAGGVSWQDGYCTQPCTPGNPCAGGGGCAPVAEGFRCLAPCGPGGACRAGYACHPRFLVCQPDCRVGYPCPPEAPCNRQGVCGGGGGPGPGPGGGGGGGGQGAR